MGCKEDCGVDKIDFLEGQTGSRSYEEGQRAPGDWEALVSQRPIAVHGMEHPGRSDIGVYLCRKLLRDQAKGLAQGKPVGRPDVDNDDPLAMYSQDSTLHIPRDPNRDDKELLLELNRMVIGVMKEADAYPAAERDAFVRRRLDEIDDRQFAKR